ncbi:MAG: hypothetical protein LBC02_11150 [Planctomycetaceae bacterium]|jgi:hypothetical protein|nr:hypothetical protein [Planctomycetaceae bacterium]
MKKITVFVFLVLVLCGCSRKPLQPDNLPKLIPCKIIITQDQAPLEGANVTLHSVTAGTQQWISGGRTDVNGVAEIRTNGRYDGVPVGKFKVLVTKTEVEPSKLSPRPDENDPNFPAWMAKSQNEVLPTYRLVDKQYANPQTTPHELEISSSKPVTVTFDTGKKVREKM